MGTHELGGVWTACMIVCMYVHAQSAAHEMGAHEMDGVWTAHAQSAMPVRRQECGSMSVMAEGRDNCQMRGDSWPSTPIYFRLV